MVGCTALCQANQNPAPKIPLGDDAKGNKRPLLRRDRSSTWEGDRPGKSLEQKALGSEAPGQTKARFPMALQGSKPVQLCCDSLGHPDVELGTDLRQARSHAAFSLVPPS